VPPPSPTRRGALLGAASLAASLAVGSPIAAAAPAAPAASTTTTIGAARVSALGAGTWQFGNQLLWNYDPAQDGELRATFDELLGGPVNLAHDLPQVARQEGTHSIQNTFYDVAATGHTSGKIHSSWQNSQWSVP
jgi:hypothetical protein